MASCAPVFASVNQGTLIQCGKPSDFVSTIDGGVLVRPRLQVLSKSSNFSGPAGKNWQLIMKDKELKSTPTTAIRAEIVEDLAGPRSLLIQIQEAVSATGPVGTQIRILLADDNRQASKAEFTVMGGFAGGMHDASKDLVCVGQID